MTNQTFATVSQNIFADAKKKNLTAKEICLQLVKNSPKRQSAIKEFLILSGKTAPVGTAALLTEAGNLIIDQSESDNINVNNLLSYPTSNIPSRYRSQKFYRLATSSPAAFLACIIYAADSESSFRKKISDARKQFGNWVKEQGQAVENTAKEIGLAPARGAFLLLLRVNFRNLAARITNYDKQFPSDRTSSPLKQKWEKLGGDWAPLITTARENANKKPLLRDPNSSFTGAEIGTAIAAGAAIIAAITPILKLAKGDDVIEELQKGLDDAQKGLDDATAELKKDRTQGNFEYGITNNKAVLLGLGLAALTIVAIFYFNKKK